MKGDVKHIITDFGIGTSVTKGEGLHVKLGVSNVESDIVLTVTDAMTKEEIREKLGYSPLADSVIDSLSAGCSTIYALPLKVVTQGSITELEKKFASGGTITVEGKPTNDYKIKVIITGTGGRNTGAFKYYIDDLESDEFTIPQAGVFEIKNIGLKINFSEHDFAVNDTVTYSTTKPSTNNQNILEALEILKNSSLEFEFIHIACETEKELWATISVEEENFFDKFYKPCIFVCEARNLKENETIDQYAQYLRNQKKGVTSRGLQVVAGRCTYMREGKKVNINSGSLIMGLYAKSKVQQSIGQVDIFDIKGALDVVPRGAENIISEMDDLGYTMVRTYSGVEGIYVNNARTFAKAGSDYEYTERTRTMYKAVRETRKTALLKMHSQVDMSSVEKSLKQITEFINVPVEKMVENKELASARVEIPKGQDLLATSKLIFKIRAVPIGILRQIEIDMGFENNN